MPPQDPGTVLARVEGNTVITTIGGQERRLRIDGDRAIVMLGDEQVGVKVAGGYLTKVIRSVKLELGTDLYTIDKNPNEASKVSYQQPGYMKKVAALGGQLKVPPAILDPVTGQWGANPRVECYPGTSIIRSVTATAVALAPDASTGQLHASVQTLTVDAEHVLRQALLKIDREDSVRILSEEEIGEERKAGTLKGWTVIPLTPPYAWIAANMRMQTVREAFQTFQNQSSTIRQRACTKAERLACDHNPVLREVYDYGSLTKVWSEPDKDGERYLKAAPYKMVSCVAWVRHEDQEGMDKLIKALASGEDVMGVEQVVRGHEVIDVGETDPEDAFDEDTAREAPRLEQAPDEPSVQAREAVAVRAEPVPVVEEKAAPAAVAASSQSPAIRERAEKTLKGLDEKSIAGARALAGVGDIPLDAMTDSQLRALTRAALE